MVLEFQEMSLSLFTKSMIRRLIILASQLCLGEIIKVKIHSLHVMVLLYNLCRRARVMKNLQLFYNRSIQNSFVIGQNYQKIWEFCISFLAVSAYKCTIMHMLEFNNFLSCIGFCWVITIILSAY